MRLEAAHAAIVRRRRFCRPRAISLRTSVTRTSRSSRWSRERGGQADGLPVVANQGGPCRGLCRGGYGRPAAHRSHSHRQRRIDLGVWLTESNCRLRDPDLAPLLRALTAAASADAHAAARLTEQFRAALRMGSPTCSAQDLSAERSERTWTRSPSFSCCWGR